MERPKNAHDPASKAPDAVDLANESNLKTSDVNVHDIFPKKKKSVKKWLVLIIVLIVIALGVAWALLQFHHATTTSSTTASGSTTATHFSSSSDLTTKATANAEGVALTPTIIDGTGGTTTDGFFAYSIPAYLTPGAKFKTQPTEGSGAGYTSDSLTASANYNKFSAFLAANGFSKTSSQDGGSGYISANDEVTFTKYAVYTSSDRVCSLWNADASGTLLKNALVSIGCADKSSYEKAYSALVPFYSAYTKANSTTVAASTLTFGAPVASTGKSDYKNVVLYQEDTNITSSDSDKTFFSGYYYMAPSSSDWTFVARTTNSALACTAFNTDVLKSAFSGANCLDATGKTTTLK